MKRDTIDAAEELALKGMKAMSEFLSYRGTDPQYLQRAKVGCVALGAYSRTYAARTNRIAVKLAAGKAAREMKAIEDRKRLKSA